MRAERRLFAKSASRAPFASAFALRCVAWRRVAFGRAPLFSLRFLFFASSFRVSLVASFAARSLLRLACVCVVFVCCASVKLARTSRQRKTQQTNSAFCMALEATQRNSSSKQTLFAANSFPAFRDSLLPSRKWRKLLFATRNSQFAVCFSLLQIFSLLFFPK